ncbi:MAG: helix-turn-helix transcriptional regulator [Planctomycetes bacterium]|nr:helix-turn-helix transcriptional regulator [Planctomycetota bacterium]
MTNAIAEDCGYADVFHFSKQFSRIMACSPRAWQQGHL